MKPAVTTRADARRDLRPAVVLASLVVIAAATAAVAATTNPSLQHALVLVVLAPLFEESVFRAGVQEQLARLGRGPGLAIVATALLFAVAHVAVSGDPRRIAVVLPGLAIGVVYARTGRVRDCVALHAAMNAAWLAAHAVL
jgi:membrane protease YdiL (CAAX protease family)